MSTSQLAVETVRGPVTVEELGHTQMHEHLLLDLWRGVPEDTPAADWDRYYAPVTPRNYYWARRHHSRDDLLLSDVSLAAEELAAYRSAGGGTIVDVTSRGLGRRPEALRDIACRTDVHIVMGSGYYYSAYHPPGVAGRSSDEIAQELVTEFAVGVGQTDIRPGIIGEIGMSWPQEAAEVNVLTGAALAQQEVGATISVHPGRNPAAPEGHLDILRRAGASLERVIVGHVDRTLSTTAAMLRLAESGCYIEFDLFGQESSFYGLEPSVDMPNDGTRIDHILELVSRGHLDQILISQDICHKTNLAHYGGEGYTHILTNVIPMMYRKGLSEAQVRAITVTNPARALARPISIGEAS